ncbi:uncharacterized protein V6R79_016128 [Siganus canaliculatus]
MEMLGLIGGDNSEVEDLSDIDDPVGDAEYQPPLSSNTTPGPSHQERSKKGRGMRWKASLLTPDQAQFDHEEEAVQDREGWTPLDYIQQYIDKDLVEIIADCSNATSLSRSGDPLNTTADEIFPFFWCLYFDVLCTISCDQDMIPFTGACPCRQYLPMKPNPVGIKNFVCATADGIVLDFEIYQGADGLLQQVEEPGNLGLGGLGIDRLSQTLHPNTNVYCD